MFTTGIAVFKLSLRNCSSLKDKRRLIKSIVDRLGNTKIVGISEISENDLWKNSSIGLICISSSQTVVTNTIDKARALIESYDVEIIDENRWYIKEEDLEAVFYMSRRTDRVEEICKEELSELLQRNVKDPRVGFVTITSVKISPDLKHAKVFVSVLGSEDEAEQSIEGLNSAKGFLKSLLGKHLKLRSMPDIEFIRERISEEALHLDEIMKMNETEIENEQLSD